MNKLILLLLFCFISTSCDLGGYQKIIHKQGSSYSISFLDKENEILELVSNGSAEDAKADSHLADYAYRTFSGYRKGENSIQKTIHVQNYSSDYRLFFEIGLMVLPDWRNEVVKYGLIQSEWKKLLLEPDRVNGFKKRNASSSIIRIPDFELLFKNSRLKRSELESIDSYIVRYLLTDIYFISIQEILERPERYLSMDEIDTVFDQAVVFPELSEFTVYLITKYGKERVNKLAHTVEYKKEWKSIFGEDLNETEAAFTKEKENQKFIGIFTNSAFTQNLDEYLKLYNKMTKPTLFRK